MTKTNDASCMDEYDPKSLTAEQARSRIAADITPIPGYQSVALRDSLGRILAQDIVSKLNVPAHVNSAMDGYAFNAAGINDQESTALEIVGESFAGRVFEGSVKPGECVRIMTGAVMPEGTDTVVIQEVVDRDGQRITSSQWPKTGANVRHPGEDIASGATVLRHGRKVSASDLGLLASLGVTEVRVMRRPRVAFFSTGDELRSLGEPLGTGDVYDSNRYTLFGMLTEFGADIIDMGVIPDDRDDTRAAFAGAAQVADVVVTSGGVSVGEADFVKETLDELGRVDFWKIAIKPGRPLAFGRIDDAWFFGLPGNPVSVMVTFKQFVIPALCALRGETYRPGARLQVPCGTALKKRPGRVEFQRGVLSEGGNGDLIVESTGAQGSGILSSMSEANCFIVLPMESTGVEAGEIVKVEMI